MAKNSEPIAKRCKALGISPAVMGYTNKDTFRNSYTKNRRKKSEYAMQLQEKQKVKFIYGILEKQFHSYYEKAAKAPGQTGAVLLTMVETRLDNVAFRTGFCKTRREARQAVSHGHFTVNGKKVNIPSFLVAAGDVISLKEKSRANSLIIENFEAVIRRGVPSWLELDKDNFKATLKALPNREEVTMPIQERLIVELYSK